MHDLRLITFDDNTCITANRKPITNVGADNMCQVMIIHFVQNFLAPLSHKQWTRMALRGSICLHTLNTHQALC